MKLSYYFGLKRSVVSWSCIKSAVIQTAHNRGLSFIEKNGVKPAKAMRPEREKPLKHLEYTHKNIKEAFARAMRDGVTGKVKPKVLDASLNLQTKQTIEPTYGEKDAEAFKRRADVLIGAAVCSPHVMLHRHRVSYYVGDIDKQPRVEDVLAEVSERDTEPSKKEKWKGR